MSSGNAIKVAVAFVFACFVSVPPKTLLLATPTRPCCRIFLITCTIPRVHILRL